jgi:hypothetical protein
MGNFRDAGQRLNFVSTSEFEPSIETFMLKVPFGAYRWVSHLLTRDHWKASTAQQFIEEVVVSA